MLLPNSSVVPCPCPELSCGLSSSGAVWEEQEKPRGSQSPAELWEGPCARLCIWGGRCLAERGGDSEVSPPSLSLSLLCPLLLRVLPGRHPQPCTTKCPLEQPPPPSPVRVNPHIPQALPAGNGYPGPDCQFGPVRTRVQHWEQIAAAVVAADTSPTVPLLGGCDKECRTIPAAALSPSLCLCHLAAGTGLGAGAALRVPSRCSSLSLVTFPRGWSCLCPPARSPAPRSCRIAGRSPGRKRCFLWVSQEELSPLGDVMGVTSPAQTFPAVLIIFPEFGGLGARGW